MLVLIINLTSKRKKEKWYGAALLRAHLEDGVLHLPAPCFLLQPPVLDPLLQVLLLDQAGLQLALSLQPPGRLLLPLLLLPLPVEHRHPVPLLVRPTAILLDGERKKK